MDEGAGGMGHQYSTVQDTDTDTYIQFIPTYNRLPHITFHDLSLLDHIATPISTTTSTPLASKTTSQTKRTEHKEKEEKRKQRHEQHHPVPPRRHMRRPLPRTTPGHGPLVHQCDCVMDVIFLFLFLISFITKHKDLSSGRGTPTNKATNGDIRPPPRYNRVPHGL